MQRRRKSPPLLLIAASALILAAGAVVAIPRVIQWRQAIVIESAKNQARAQCLMAAYTDALSRHPDFELTRHREFFASFQGLSVGKQAARVRKLESSLAELEAELTELLGIEEADNQHKTFSPNGFRELAETHHYPDVQPITAAPRITGHAEADRRIVRIAEARGYRLKADTDVDTLQKVEGRLLKPQAAEAYAGLKKAALKEGIRLGLISGYRSQNYQRRIFLNLLRIESRERAGKEFSLEEITRGRADTIIDRILEESSIPGYSKHHTGYAMDLTDLTSGRDFTEFAETRGFAWISANNYLNAKRFGLIPSYPEGAESQGPEPEPWEYVWVGREALEKLPPCE